jgi:hypothetical protein
MGDPASFDAFDLLNCLAGNTCVVTAYGRSGGQSVVEHLDVVNQRGETVLVCDHLLLCERRGPFPETATR